MYKNISSVFLTLTLVSPFLMANAIPKQAIKSNGQVLYTQTPVTTSNFTDMFQEGNFYGRLRNNNFYFSYNKEDGKHENNLVSALGASFVYKSAAFNGFNFNLGLYASQSFFDANKLDTIAHLKPSKDTLSRYKYVNGGSKALYAFAQANINYRYSATNFTFGRQFVETFYTKSNDTKMIPNAFDGLVLSSKDIPNSTLKLAYLTKQKLRDHEKGHALFMVGDAASAPGVHHPEWSQNDDSAMHKGLTYSALKTDDKPTDAPLIVFDAQNKSIKNLTANFSSYVVPELLSQAMGELNYKISMNGFSITPGFRYIQQFDNGAGKVGGASLSGKVNKINPAGYKNPDSLDAKMVAARLVGKMKDYKLSLAYTHILDEADLVTPWRGFPTAGYTRSMGMYNWKANVKSYRIELLKGANATGIYKKPFIQTSILYMDGDQEKSETDSIFYYAGIIQNLPAYPEFQYRVRFGFRDFVGDSSAVSDYIDSRLEFNYLF
jgi:hypothetical protein